MARRWVVLSLPRSISSVMRPGEPTTTCGLDFSFFDLPRRRGAADQQHRANCAPRILRKVAGLTMDLDGQLVRGCDDHDLCRGLRRIDPRHERKQVRQCLAGTRFRL